MTATPEPDQSSGHRPHRFDLVRRGYDPHQVERQLGALRAALEHAQRAAEAAERRAADIEIELRRVREQLASKEQEYHQNSLGFRVEKLLRFAQEEARDIRAQAEAEVQAHRAAVEQELSQRTAAVQQQQTRLEEERAAALAEIRDLRSEAEQQAQALRQQAESDAQRLRADTEAAIAYQRAEADQQLAAHRNGVEAEIARLTQVRDELATDLRRVHNLLGRFIEQHLPDTEPVGRSPAEV